MNDLKSLVFGVLLLAAVYVGHWTTIQGRPSDIQCFAPVDLSGVKK